MAGRRSFTFSKILVYLLLLVGLVFAIRYFFWDKIRESIIKHRLQSKLMSKTDSLYTIEYDSLVFDKQKGEASMKNIRIIPDTGRISKIDPLKVPYVMLDISIRSLVVRGVDTEKALEGNEIIGDTVIIDSPVINAWFMKPVQKETRIDVEAQETYRQILGKLKLIKIAEVNINNAQVYTFDFADKLRQFDIRNTDIKLHDVRIDSVSYADTSRILFCRDALFKMGKFISFNLNREELIVDSVLFNGKARKLSFFSLRMNKFDGDQPLPFCKADKFILTGVNTFEAFRNKMLVVDSIACQKITLFKPRPRAFISRKESDTMKIKKSGGFRHSYGISVNTLNFPSVNLVQSATTIRPGDEMGKFFIHIKAINAEEIMHIQEHPFDHTGSAVIRCNEIAYTTNDGLYRHRMVDLSFDPINKKVTLQSYRLTPLLPEAQYSKKVVVQKDRYDISVNNIVAEDIDFDKLLKKEFVAKKMSAASSSIKIYRDLSKPLESKSKIGKFPHQALMNSDVPTDIKTIDVGNMYLEYKEMNDLSGKSGTIRFEQSNFVLNNVTNIPEAVAIDSICTATLTSKVLGKFPLKVVFTLKLGSKDGRFAVKGNFGSVNGSMLNEITLPMAMMRIDGGYVENADFSFSGNDFATSGDFLMKYSDLKVSLLKKDKASGVIKRRRVMTFIANSVLKDANPWKGELRKININHNRDPFKSFLNLVWKSIYSGIQQTIGVAMPKSK